jgi:hypothetical protein
MITINKSAMQECIWACTLILFLSVLRTTYSELDS